MNGTQRRWVLCVAASVIAAAVWSIALRPARLGGSMTYVVVRGTSMEPTFLGGDLVITRRATAYDVGDIVAYRVPDGSFGEGIVVIHRIVNVSRVGGYVLQGDNNTVRDSWTPKDGDIVGKAWTRVPAAGGLLASMSRPLPFAGLAAAVAMTFVLVPERKRRDAGSVDAVVA